MTLNGVLDRIEHYAKHVNIIAWMFVGAGIDEAFRENWLMSVLLPLMVAFAAIQAHEEQCLQ